MVFVSSCYLVKMAYFKVGSRRQFVYSLHSALSDIQEDMLDTSVSTNDVGKGLTARTAPQVIVVSEWYREREESSSFQSVVTSFNFI